MSASTPVSGNELDTLRGAWQALDARLARIESLQIDAAEARADKNRGERVRASVRALRPLLAGQLLQALFGTGLLVFAAVFWSSHMDRLHLMLAGISLHAYAIWLLASAGHEIHQLAQIRYTTPVLELQKRLARLRRWRSRNGLVFAYAGCFIWIPAMLILFAWLGVDVWARQPGVVGWFLVSGALCAGLVYAGLRYANDPRRPTLAAHMRRHAAGQSLHRAERALAEIEAFEREGQRD
jgi:hypothetical protein